MTNQIVISRIQNRRGIKENLPQPLLPGEFALTIDTGELWIGTDPAQPPWGIRTYGTGLGDISSAEDIVDVEIVSAKFTTMDATTFTSLLDYLTGSPTPAVVLIDTDVLYDDTLTVFIAADTSIDAANTISNIVTAIGNSPVGGDHISVSFDALGAINDPDGPNPDGYAAFTADGDFLFTIAGSNAKQGSNAASLINKIHGAQLVTTLANLQVTTSGIGVGSSTFQRMEVIDTDAGRIWSDIGTVIASSVTDTLTWVSGDGIDIQIDTTNPAAAIRITNTIDSVAATPFTLTTNDPTFVDVTGLTFNLETSDISDVVILDYSLNIDGASDTSDNYTAIGTMMIVGNILVDSGLATLSDNQVEVRESGLSGAVNFQAVYDGAGSPDVIQIQYTSTFTPNVALKVLKRRWPSF